MTCNFDKDELILKVLDGVATPEEILMLSRWMEEDPANEIYFNQLKKAWNLMSGPFPSKEREEKNIFTQNTRGIACIGCTNMRRS